MDVQFGPNAVLAVGAISTAHCDPFWGGERLLYGVEGEWS